MTSPVLHRIGGQADSLVAERAVWGVISANELRQCGLTHRMIARRVSSGRLHPIHRGVYAVGHPNLTQEGHFVAAVKACGRLAALSHYSAAIHWGLLEPFTRYPDVTAPANRTRPRINTHKSRSLLSDVVVYRDIPTTRPHIEHSKTSGASKHPRRP